MTTPLRNPEATTLLEIDRYLKACKENPASEVRKYQRALVAARLPTFLRRWLWWCHANVSGTKRARYFATFGVSSVGNWGVDSVRPIVPWTTTLHYGAVDAKGDIAMRLTFDHRVIDGSGAASALNELAVILRTELLEELRSLPQGLLKAD